MSGHLKFCYLSVCSCLLFFAVTRLVPAWGLWYSPDVRYRQQTDALLKGRFALSQTPAALRNDLVWSNGGVHQVWGLGVPAWRLPFEVIARLLGQQAFPDRIALGVAFSLLAYWAWRILWPGCAPPHSADAAHCCDPSRLAAILIILFFPPFVQLCRGTFKVYEEAVAYGYLYAIFLFMGLLALARCPSVLRLFLLALASGIAPLVRPTVGIYGMATLVLAVPLARRFGHKWSRIGAGLSGYGFGFGLLLMTNWIRFGSCLEFGHNLNLNGFPNWYFTRFYCPFEEVSWAVALRELFGAMFMSPQFNVYDWRLKGLFWGQSDVSRWRFFYGDTFNLRYLAALLAAWGFGGYSLLCRQRHPCRTSTSTKLSLAWSAGATTALVLFYAKTPVISSRYLLDFAPGFAIALAGPLLCLDGHWLRAPGRTRAALVAFLTLVLAWLLLEGYGGRTSIVPAPAVSQAQVLRALAEVPHEPVEIRNSYELGTDLRSGGAHIDFNGEGWDSATGRMDTTAVFFVRDPQRLQIIVSMDSDLGGDDDRFSNLQAKIGLESLILDSVESCPEGRRLTFRLQPHSRNRYGIQVLFLAYVVRTHQVEQRSPTRLVKVQWSRGS